MWGGCGDSIVAPPGVGEGGGQVEQLLKGHLPTPWGKHLPIADRKSMQSEEVRFTAEEIEHSHALILMHYTDSWVDVGSFDSLPGYW